MALFKEEQELVLPFGTEFPYNCYTFMHFDGTDKHISMCQHELVDEVIRQFISFLKGCDYSEDCIYSFMRGVTDEYFEYKDEEIQTKPVPLQQDDLK
jgi:hypothetical protein